MFKGKTVIISGGAGDIGLAAALKFAELGANIAIGDIKPKEEVEDLLEKVVACGVNCHYKQIDIANAEVAYNWVEEVSSLLGIPTIIIANAAITRLSGFSDITAEQWVNDMNVNVNGAFFLTKYATDRLLKHGLEGRVVFVGSWAATHIHSHMPAYSVSKAAIHMLNKCMALELAPKGILVNEIAPGYVDAGLSGRIWNENPDRRERATGRIPTKQVITAAEVAEQIVFLCDPKNRHMVGSTLLMDGGLSL